MRERLSILGLPLDPLSMSEAVGWAIGKLNTKSPWQVVTLNPEIVVRALRDENLARAVAAAELVTADGVGILWAAKRLCRLSLPGRVSGVDLTLKLFDEAGSDLRVFFLGGRPGVAEEAAANAAAEYGVVVAGSQHGYFEEAQPVVEKISRSGANVVLAGMGEKQEVFLHRYKNELAASLLIGVGGTLDVLAGRVKRVPSWAQKLNIEWLLRIALDRKRWPRAARLLKFAVMVERARRARNTGC